MEVKKILYLFSAIFILFSCGKSTIQGQDKTVSAAEKPTKNNFEQIFYTSKSLYEGKINVFEFKDHKVTIEYLTETLLGIGNDQHFNIYKSAFDLDLGEVDLLRFDTSDSQIYMVELSDGNHLQFNMFLFKENEMFHLGDLNFDLSNLKLNEEGFKNDFTIKINNDIVEVGIANGKKEVKKDFILNKPLQPFKSYDGIQEYLKVNEPKNIGRSQFSQEYKSDLFQLGVNEDMLSVKVKGSVKEYVNDYILEGYASCPDTSLDQIVFKDQFFTIEKYNCINDFYLKEYITFKYTNEIVLHKYSVEFTSRKDPDENLKTSHFTTKDFGKVKFENVDKGFLNNLRQK